MCETIEQFICFGRCHWFILIDMLTCDWTFVLVKRDISERGRTLDTILNQYINTVKPAFEEFCLPTKKFADVIIPRGADNTGQCWSSMSIADVLYI